MVVAPGHAHLHAIKILHRDKFRSQRQLVPRHCTSAHLLVFYTETIPSYLENLYRDRASVQYNLYHDGKNTCHTLLAPPLLSASWRIARGAA
jgi:hypothetical protein